LVPQILSFFPINLSRLRTNPEIRIFWMEGIGSTAAAWKQYMKMSAQEKRNKNQCDHLYYTLSISNCKMLWLFYIHSFCYALSYTMSRYLVKVMYLWKPKRLLIWNGGSTWIVHNNHLTNDPKTELRSMDYTMPNMNIRIQVTNLLSLRRSKSLPP